jgi:NAD(P)-dependent dehydrogenase (short-subunit alcohol dehydrogenase family)
MKTIIVTGANGNLGIATVKKLLDEGYAVIGVDSASTHLEFALSNTGFTFHTVNLLNEEEAAGFIDTIIKQHGKIDGALLLVGGFAMGSIETTTGADIRKMYALNFETVYFVARPLFLHMQQNKYGRLVFVGSRPALQAEQGKGSLAYSLTKALLFKLADLINAAAKGTNVTASVLVPSTIDTAINRKDMPNANPADWVKPEQLADVLEFICSDKGSPIREAVYKVYNNG